MRKVTSKQETNIVEVESGSPEFDRLMLIYQIHEICQVNQNLDSLAKTLGYEQDLTSAIRAAAESQFKAVCNKLYDWRMYHKSVNHEYQLDYDWHADIDELVRLSGSIYHVSQLKKSLAEASQSALSDATWSADGINYSPVNVRRLEIRLTDMLDTVVNRILDYPITSELHVLT